MCIVYIYLHVLIFKKIIKAFELIFHFTIEKPQKTYVMGGLLFCAPYGCKRRRTVKANATQFLNYNIVTVFNNMGVLNSFFFFLWFSFANNNNSGNNLRVLKRLSKHIEVLFWCYCWGIVDNNVIKLFKIPDLKSNNFINENYIHATILIEVTTLPFIDNDNLSSHSCNN